MKEDRLTKDNLIIFCLYASVGWVVGHGADSWLNILLVPIAFIILYFIYKKLGKIED